MKRVLFRWCCGVLFLAPVLTHAAGSFDPATHCRSVSAETCATAQALGRGLEAFLVAENLFDEEYQEALGYPALGRSVRAGLRLRLGGGRRP